MRHRARVFDGIIYKRNNLLELTIGRAYVALKVRRNTAEHKRNAGQFLANPIVQLVTQAAPLAIRDVENFLF